MIQPQRWGGRRNTVWESAALLQPWRDLLSCKAFLLQASNKQKKTEGERKIWLNTLSWPNGKFQKMQQQVVIQNTVNRCLDYIMESSIGKSVSTEEIPDILEATSNKYRKGECWQWKVILTKVDKQRSSLTDKGITWYAKKGLQNRRTGLTC